MSGPRSSCYAQQRLTLSHTVLLQYCSVSGIAESELLARILKRSAKIDLRENSIGPAGAKSLANAPEMAGAKTLDNLIVSNETAYGIGFNNYLTRVLQCTRRHFYRWAIEKRLRSGFFVVPHEADLV